MHSKGIIALELASGELARESRQVRHQLARAALVRDRAGPISLWPMSIFNDMFESKIPAISISVSFSAKLFGLLILRKAQKCLTSFAFDFEGN